MSIGFSDAFRGGDSPEYPSDAAQWARAEWAFGGIDTPLGRPEETEPYVRPKRTERVEVVTIRELAPTHEVVSLAPKEIPTDDPARRVFEATASAVVEDVSEHLAKFEMKDASLIWSDATDPAKLADFITSTQELIHKHGIGAAAQAAFTPIAGDLAEPIANFVSCYEIPGDRAILWARRGAQCLGIVFGIVSGQPTMALAPLKSLIVDEAQRALKHAVVEAITTPFRSGPTTHPISATPQTPGPDIVELAELAKAFGLTHLVPGDSVRPFGEESRPRWIVVRSELEIPPRYSNPQAPS